MGKKNSVALLILIVFIGLIATTNNFPNYEISATRIVKKLQVSDPWDLSFKIMIDNNWSDTRDAYDWCSGLGTAEQPYIIKDITIDIRFQDDCMEIRNTDEYFIIKNSFFANASDTDYGIYLYNVTNGEIDNCEFFNNSGFGIKLERSEGLIVSNSHFNIIFGHSISAGSGILLEDQCHNNLIVDNYIRCCYNGVKLLNNCDKNSISGNSICTSSMNLSDNCDNNIIENNIIDSSNIEIYKSQFNRILYNCFFYFSEYYFRPGITLIDANHTEVAYNHIESYEDGIGLNGNVELCNICSNLIENCNNGIILKSNCHNNTVKSNTIRNNDKGITLGGNNNNTVIYNIFENNGIHAIDNGLDNMWNDTIKGNYWDNYTGLDEDNNGIGDIPYNISGSTGSKDYLPIFNRTEIRIESPLDNSYWNTEPSICVSTVDPNINSIWYTICIFPQIEFLQVGVVEILSSGIWQSLAEEPLFSVPFWNSFAVGSFFMSFFGSTLTGEIIYFDEYMLIKDTTFPSTYNFDFKHEYCYYSPEVSWYVSDRYLNSCWYSFNDQPKKYYFAKDVVGRDINITDKALEGWYTLPDGNVHITFGVDDKAGNVRYHVEHVLKCKEKDNRKRAIDGYEISLFLLGCLSISIFLTKFYQKRLRKSF